MNKIYLYFSFFVCVLKYGSEAAKITGPSVYVVTPSPSNHGENEARSAPFYYHNWMRRMDSPQNATTTSTTPKVKTPDLIFAEFESESENNMQKSIRKLLEKERVTAKTTTTTTTTSSPIYVPDEDESSRVNYEYKPEDKKEDSKKSEVDMTDYFALYNNLYGDVKNSHVPKDAAPVYMPSTTSSTTVSTTTTLALNDVQNIWHIIDSEKHNAQTDKWEEIPLNTNNDSDQTSVNDIKSPDNEEKKSENEQIYSHIPENFALPGFAANTGNGAENESRAIRTEPNIRFPYVSLKPFLMKNINNPYNGFSNSKKSNNMFSLEDFKEIKNPVRGEIQDNVPMSGPIDRYNPAQPYLPHDYGSKSKQSSPASAPQKTSANLVPPPPPPPKVTANDFPAPTNYESFPPYAPSGPSAAPAPPAPPMSPPVSIYKAPDFSDDSGPGPLDDSADNTPMDLGYRYKPPAPPAFVPTLPTPVQPFNGYSYNKPSGPVDTPSAMDTSGYNYNKPAMTLDSPPAMDMGGYSYNKPSFTFEPPPVAGGDAPDDKPDFHQYHYDKPTDHGPSPPSFPHDSDYPELIYDKPHGGMKGGNDMKGNDAGMMPPPPPPDVKPGMDGPSMDDGFPPDFHGGDFKFHHDFDDHDHDFHHYHHHTTTTTTETPRVNRFSYYYLGKKLYYLPLYFSVYFIVYVGALIIKAVLRHKIVYPNSWRPNDMTASFFAKRSVDSWDLSNENLHEVTGRVTRAIAVAAEKYMNQSSKKD